MIRSTKSRFFAIMAIVGIGVAFFVGVYSSSTIMDASVDAYEKQYTLKDFTIYSGLGFDEEDVKALNDLDDIALAEGKKFVDVVATSGNRSLVTRIHSYTDTSKINQFKLVEGRMPENEHEALAEAGNGMSKGFEIGTQVSLSRPDGDLDTFLKEDTVTVVGMIDTPLYLNMTKENSTLDNRTIKTYLYVPEEAFSIDRYLELDAVTSEGKQYDAFSDAYYAYIDKVEDTVKQFALSRQDVSFENIKQEALDAYHEGLRKYKNAEQEYLSQIQDAQSQLDEAEKKLEDSEQQWKEGKSQLEAARLEVDRQEKENTEKIHKGLNQIQDGLNQIADARSKLQQAKDLKQTEYTLMDQQEKLEGYLYLLGFMEGDTKLSLFSPFVEEETKEQLKELGIDLDTDTVEKAREVLQSSDAQLNDGMTQLKEGIAEIEKRGTDSQQATLTSNEQTIQKLYGERKELYAEQLLLENLQSVLKEIPDTFDEVPLKILKENKENIKQIVDRIQQAMGEEGSIKKTYTEIQNRISDYIQEHEQDNPQLCQRLSKLSEQLKQAYAQLDNALKDIDMSQLEILFDEDFLKQLEKSGVTVDFDNDTVGSLKQKVETCLEQNKDSYAQYSVTLSALENSSKEMYSAIIENQLQVLTDTETDLYAKQSEAEAGLKTLQTELLEARNKIAQNEATLVSSKQQLEEGRHTLSEKKAEFEKGKQDGQNALDDAEKQLEEAKKQIEEMKAGEWTVLDRKAHYSSVTYRSTIHQMAAIGRIFPVFFLLVAVLVCLTTMARTVDEQRGEIGALRALGYSELQCAGKYLIYAGIATIVGEVAGLVIGTFTFPVIIYNTWKMMFVLPEIVLKLDWKIVILTILVFLVVMLLTTWIACKKDMQEVPAQLLRPKAPKLGKGLLIEKWKWLWSHISFTWKVTLRNLFRYKQRFFMTVIGVAGCTALLVTGYGVKDSITMLVDKQFNEISTFDGYVSLQDTLSLQDTDSFISSLNQRDDIQEAKLYYGYTSQPVNSENITDTISVQMFENPQDVKNVYNLRTRKGHTPLTLSMDGVIISEKLSENMHLKVGDTFSLEDEDGKEMKVRIAGICEMYVEHYCFMTTEYYESVTGKTPVEKLVSIQAAKDADYTALEKYLVSCDQVQGIYFYQDILNRFNTMVSSLNLIIWVIIISSMTLAFVVLTNLINVNIAERQREIATLKVLGFRKKEVENYIYKENNILTLFGAIAGIPLGIWLHHTIMRTVEMDYVMFGRTVQLTSILISVALTLLFGILVNFFMRRKLHSIEMVESLKSVE